MEQRVTQWDRATPDKGRSAYALPEQEEHQTDNHGRHPEHSEQIDRHGDAERDPAGVLKFHPCVCCFPEKGGVGGGVVFVRSSTALRLR